MQYFSSTQKHHSVWCWYLCQSYIWTRWRHQMKTFSALLAICAGNSPVPGEFPAQRPVSRSFDVFFDLHPNKRLSKQSRGWWFETPSCPLWRHRYEKRLDKKCQNNTSFGLLRLIIGLLSAGNIYKWLPIERWITTANHLFPENWNRD